MTLLLTICSAKNSSFSFSRYDEMFSWNDIKQSMQLHEYRRIKLGGLYSRGLGSSVFFQCSRMYKLDV